MALRETYLASNVLNDVELMMKVCKAVATQSVVQWCKSAGWEKDDIIQECYINLREAMIKDKSKSYNFFCLCRLTKFDLINKLRTVTHRRSAGRFLFENIWQLGCRLDNSRVSEEDSSVNDVYFLSESSKRFKLDSVKNDVRECVEHLISELQLGKKDALVLFYVWVQGETFKEAGNKLGITESAISRRVSNIRKKIFRRYSFDKFRESFFGEE